MDKIYENVCPRDCYGTCRLQTVVRDNRLISITGDKDDPYTRGALCAKGYAYLEYQSAPGRLLYPLKQKHKGSGQWERVSWESALSEIAHKFLKIKEEEKTLLSVCLDKYLGNMGLLSQAVEGFFRSIGYITFMDGSPCEAAGVDAFVLSYGACKKPSPSDMASAKVIIVWGGNPAWTAPHQMHYVFEARAKGGRLVVIDPYFSATAARADVYIQIKPGMDGLLALGMARVLLEENLLADDFLRDCTSGWEELRAYLAQMDMGQIARYVGVPEEEIRELARLYGKNRPATIWLGLGAQHHPNGGQNYRAINALAAMTGNIGVPGGNVHYATAEANALAGMFAEIRPPADARGLTGENGMAGHRQIHTGRFAELAQAEPPIRFLWIAGRNPVARDPDSTRIKEVLQSLETVVVVDTNLTASAQYADYVLPAKTFLEQEDIVISNWHYGVALNEQTLPPSGECKSDLEIMRDLAVTLNRLAPGFSTFPLTRTDSEWLDSEMRGGLYSRLGIQHYRELKGKHLLIDLPSVPWQDHVFPTASGKYEFVASSAGLWQVPSLPIPLEPPGLSSAAYPLQLLSVRSYATLNSQFGELLEFLEPFEGRLLLNPLTAKAKRVEEGEQVSVYNELGEVRLSVSITFSLPPDVVVVYADAQTQTENMLNSLIVLKDADLGMFSAKAPGLTFKHCCVNLCKVQKS